MRNVSCVAYQHFRTISEGSCNKKNNITIFGQINAALLCTSLLLKKNHTNIKLLNDSIRS